MSIKCHSSFVHYNMFHNSCHGGGNNYGSIFNITNNCRGGHTSFWGGLGAGLGFGLGNMFGGFFGNIMGGFGNMFGMGGFGMGGFGFPMFNFGGFGMGNGWGSGWGGGSNVGSSSGSDYSRYSSKKANDKDYADIIKLDKKADELIEDFKKNPKETQDIDDLIKKLELKKDGRLKDGGLKDDVHTEENKKHIDVIIERLKKAKSSAPTATATEPTAAAAPDPTATPATDPPAAPATAPTAATDPDTTATDGAGGATADVPKYCDGIMAMTDDDYKNLSPEQQGQLEANIKALDPSQCKQLALNSKVPEIRKAAKQSFYPKDYTNVTSQELTEDIIQNITSVIDTSEEITDFTDIETIKDITKDSGKLKSFLMKAKSGTTVKYTFVEEKDGELIFRGKNPDQKYVLQKGSDGKYHLMQYEYHEGWNSADVKNNA